MELGWRRLIKSWWSMTCARPEHVCMQNIVKEKVTLFLLCNDSSAKEEPTIVRSKNCQDQSMHYSVVVCEHCSCVVLLLPRISSS